ncbi:MAG: helicase-related protein [Marinagarivorans sp.]|nr:helicase-related protein [Marinagarivorans sp.]
MLLRVVQKHSRDFGVSDAISGVGIIYVTLQKTAEDVANFLAAQGVNAKAYHAGLENETRQAIQNGFMAGAISVVVATIAFGMGVDKADIRFVVHYDLPKSIENYSQEIGRAGRDNLPSRCVVLANLDGLQTVENFVYGDTPEFHSIQKVLKTIAEQTQNHQWELQLYGLSNHSNIRQLTLKTLLVQLELRGILTALYSYSAEHKIKLLHDKNTILQRFNGERADFIAAIFNAVRFKKIWGEMDFDALYKHYGGERKRALAALEYLHEKKLIDLQSSGLTEVYSVNTELLQQPALADELFQAFKQHEVAEITRIGYLVRFLESKTCLSFGLARYFDDANAPEHCGHCSVCRGRIAELTRTHTTDIPAPTLIAAAQNIKNHLHTKGEKTVSHELIARFLAGISVPLFTRTKARQAGGFGLAETMRYEDILKVIEGM